MAEKGRLGKPEISRSQSQQTNENGRRTVVQTIRYYLTLDCLDKNACLTLPEASAHRLPAIVPICAEPVQARFPLLQVMHCLGIRSAPFTA